MNPRLKQLGLALICAATLNCIGWPSPHGGLQFIGQVLWTPQHGPPSSVPILVAVPLGVLILASLLPYRIPRVGGTILASVWLGVLFIMLFMRIYPPAWPIALITAVPFLGSLGGSVWFSLCPREKAV